MLAPSLIGPHPANYTTPPRKPKSTADAKVGNKFSADDAANLASMLNVHVEAAVDALKRNDGDVNAAAEWLLSMPSYVAVNSAAVHPEPPKKQSGHVYTYPSNDISVVQAELDDKSSYVMKRKPGETSAFEMKRLIKLIVHSLSISGR